MPNIASILKEEIARVARKELRVTTDSLKKAASQHRSDIAALKRRLAAAEQEIKKLRKGGARAGKESANESQETGRAFRFSA
jgi:cell division protein FtsB